MRRLDDTPIDPDIAEALDAIDATLAGDPVDPRHAELAELALLVAAERPQMDAGFAAALDARVQRRFEPGSPSGVSAPARRRWRVVAPLAGLASAAFAAVVAVIVLGSGGSTHAPLLTQSVAAQAPARQPSAAAAPAPAPATATVGSVTPDVLQPPPNGRKVIQSGQLALATTPGRVDDVAQEVFNVVGSQNGVVNRSQVTATGGPDGYAQFDLSIPSANLPQTMAELSRLRYAQVTSRTDATQDVNDHYLALARQLSDAQALRTSLLKQLAAATTQQQISSLHAQISDAEGKISDLQGELRFLSHQVAYSNVSVTVSASAAPPSHSSSGGFTIGRAGHDAVRVLAVAAGVALIALAGLIPAGLLAALGWWITAALRRRRREQALDLA